MKVYAFESTEDGTPNGQWVARIYLGTATDPKTGKAKPDYHPVLFSGPTEGSVRLQAATWWEAEVARERARQAPRRKPADKPVENAVPVDDIGDVL